MNRFRYPVLLTPAEEGGYVVTCRDPPELVTQGESVYDALERAADAMDEVFATYLTEGLDFPEPSKAKRREHMVAPPLETVAKAALYVRHASGGDQQSAAGQAPRRRREGGPPALEPALWLEAAANRQGNLVFWGSALSSASRQLDRRHAATSRRSGRSAICVQTGHSRRPWTAPPPLSRRQAMHTISESFWNDDDL